MVAELFHTDRRTDRHDEISSRFPQLCIAPINHSVNAVQGNNRCLFSDPYKTDKYSMWEESRNSEC